MTPRKKNSSPTGVSTASWLGAVGRLMLTRLSEHALNSGAPAQPHPTDVDGSTSGRRDVAGRTRSLPRLSPPSDNQIEERVMALYEIALQVVPVLMIALFLDTRTASHISTRTTWRTRAQHRLYVVLCVSAFVVSLLVVADILRHGRATEALVIGALTGCVSVMAGQAWLRFDGAPASRPDRGR